MNSQIETWRVQAYEANVLHLAQQQGSKLEKYCRKAQFTGKVDYFDRLGTATAVDKVGRNVDTPNENINHSRRALTTQTRHWGTLVDSKDEMQNIHDPMSEYAKAAAMALGRKRDNVIISAAFGTAYGGEDGTSTSTLGTAQKVAAVASSALDYPNLQLLRKAKRIMDAAQIEGKRVLVYSADFLDIMLSVQQLTSSDYNSIKALVAGEINTFMGFEWVHCEEIASSDFLAATVDSDTFKFDTTTGMYSSSGTALGGTEKCAMVFVGDRIVSGENVNGRKFRIGERDDKSYSAQIYTAQDMGAVRLEEAGVVQLIYKAS